MPYSQLEKNDVEVFSVDVDGREERIRFSVFSLRVDQFVLLVEGIFGKIR